MCLLMCCKNKDKAAVCAETVEGRQLAAVPYPFCLPVATGLSIFLVLLFVYFFFEQ